MSSQLPLPFEERSTALDPKRPTRRATTPPDLSPGHGREPLTTRIVRSRRRKKTVGAQLVDGVVEVVVPVWMSKAEAERFADEMRGRFEKKRAKSDVDLMGRARALCRTYDIPRPASVRWVTNQNSRWGSCTPADGAIRLSDRLRTVPLWVVDYVLVHELAHLRHPDHSPAFWATVRPVAVDPVKQM